MSAPPPHLPLVVVIPPGRDSDTPVDPVAELNPFGAWFITATWLLLFLLNAWCWRKLLGSKRNFPS